MTDNEIAFALGLGGLALVADAVNTAIKASKAPPATARPMAKPPVDYVGVLLVQRRAWLSLRGRVGVDASGTSVPRTTVKDAQAFYLGWTSRGWDMGPAYALTSPVRRAFEPWLELDRSVAVADGELTLKGATVFWKCLHAAATDLDARAATQHLNSFWTRVSASVSEAIADAPRTVGEWLVRAAAGAANVAGQVAGGLGAGIVAGIFSNPVGIALLGGAAYFAYRAHVAR